MMAPFLCYCFCCLLWVVATINGVTLGLSAENECKSRKAPRGTLSPRVQPVTRAKKLVCFSMRLVGWWAKKRFMGRAACMFVPPRVLLRQSRLKVKSKIRLVPDALVHVTKSSCKVLYQSTPRWKPMIIFKTTLYWSLNNLLMRHPTWKYDI